MEKRDVPISSPLASPNAAAANKIRMMKTKIGNSTAIFLLIVS